MRLIVPAAAMLAALFTAQPTLAAAVVGTVTALDGQASVVLPDGSGEAPLAVQDQVREGAVLRTGADGRLRVTLRDGSTLSLGAQSEVRLDHLALDAAGQQSGLLTHLRGYLRAVIAKLRRGSEFEVSTVSMIAGVRGTDWIQHVEDGATEIFVANGQVACRTPRTGEQVVLARGEGVTFQPSGSHTPVVRWGQAKIDRFVAATRVP